MRSLWIALSSLLTLACAHGAAITAERAEPARVDDEEAPRRALRRPRAPRVASAPNLAPPEPWLVVGTRAIRMSDGAPFVALEDGRVRPTDRGGAHGTSIVPLYARFASASDPEGPLGVAIDPDIPFRTVLDVVDTLGEAERELALLVVEHGGALRALPLSREPPREVPVVAERDETEGGSPRSSDDVAAERVLVESLGPRGQDLARVLREGAAQGSAEEILAQATGVCCGDSAAPAGHARNVEPPREPPLRLHRPSRDLRLTLLVEARGITVYGSGGGVAPGCDELARPVVITVPRRAGQHDLSALRRCLDRVRRGYPDEDRVFVNAEPDIAFDAVANVIATARGTTERPLFPRAVLGAPPRGGRAEIAGCASAIRPSSRRRPCARRPGPLRAPRGGSASSRSSSHPSRGAARRRAGRALSRARTSSGPRSSRAP